MTYRLLICGDRNWTDKRSIEAIIRATHAEHEDLVIIEGEARGADSIARDTAIGMGIPVEPYAADWQKFGRAAGPIRNQQMLETQPDMVIGFHNDLENSKGTKDMLNRAKKEGIPVLNITSAL